MARLAFGAMVRSAVPSSQLHRIVVSHCLDWRHERFAPGYTRPAPAHTSSRSVRQHVGRDDARVAPRALRAPGPLAFLASSCQAELESSAMRELPRWGDEGSTHCPIPWRQEPLRGRPPLAPRPTGAG